MYDRLADIVTRRTISYRNTNINKKGNHAIAFSADHTKGHAYTTVLCPSVRLSVVCNVSIVYGKTW